MAIASLLLSGFDSLSESWSETKLRYDFMNLPHMDVVSAQQHSSATSPAANMYPDIPTRESHDLHRCGPLRKNPSPQTAHSSSAALAFSVGTFAYPIDVLQPGVTCKNADACHGQVQSRFGMCVLDLQPRSGYKAHIYIVQWRPTHETFNVTAKSNLGCRRHLARTRACVWAFDEYALRHVTPTVVRHTRIGVAVNTWQVRTPAVTKANITL